MANTQPTDFSTSPLTVLAEGWAYVSSENFRIEMQRRMDGEKEKGTLFRDAAPWACAVLAYHLTSPVHDEGEAVLRAAHDLKVADRGLKLQEDLAMYEFSTLGAWALANIVPLAALAEEVTGYEIEIAPLN